MTNTYRVDGDYAYIDLKASKTLPQGKVTIIDVADLPKAQEFPGAWRISGINRKYGGMKYYACGEIYTPHSERGTRKRNAKYYALHRWLFGTVEEKRPIDHINHDTLDNRRSCNVRFSDHFLNSLNREITIPRQDKNPLRSGKYIASIMVKGRLIRIGVFNTPEESVLARVAVRSFALQYFGNDNETDCQYVDVGCDKHGSA